MTMHRYHPIAQKMLAADLSVTLEELSLAAGEAESLSSTSSSPMKSKKAEAKGSSTIVKTDFFAGLFNSWTGILTVSSVLLGVGGILFYFMKKRHIKKI